MELKHINLRVNAEGEEVLFSLKKDSSSSDYWQVYSARHSGMHEGAAFPKSFPCALGTIFLCPCGLRTIAPSLIRDASELVDKFKQFNS